MPRISINQAEVMAEIAFAKGNGGRGTAAIAYAIVLLADNVMRAAHVVAGTYDETKDDRKSAYRGPGGSKQDIPPITEADVPPREYGWPSACVCGRCDSCKRLMGEIPRRPWRVNPTIADQDVGGIYAPGTK